MTVGVLDGRGTGIVVMQLGESTAEATRQRVLAEAAADRSETAADRAEALSLLQGYYATVAAGAAATAAPATFVSDESGSLVLYDEAGNSIYNPGSLDTLTLPATTSAGIGAIYQGADRLLHTYNDGTNVGGTVGQNLFVGVRSGNFSLSGVANTCGGYESGMSLTSASLTTMFGTRAGRLITSGGVNSGFGCDALATCTTGEYNDAFGCKALTNLTIGSRNKMFGQSAGLRITTGNDNCGFGQEVLIQNLTGLQNCAFGNYSQYTSADKNYNCSFGTNSLRNNNADYNSAFGTDALFSNTLGTLNLAAAYQAAYDNTTGSGVVALGPYALRSSNGDNMTALGNRAGYGVLAGDEASTVDQDCTWLGAQAGRSNSVPTATPIVNSTALGFDAKATKSNQIMLGKGTVTEVRMHGNLLIAANDAGTGAANVIGIANGTAPSTSPAGMGQLWVEAGALKYRGSGGTVTQLAAA